MMMVFGGQKSAKFVIFSQNHPTMMGKKSQKIPGFGSNSQQKKKQKYNTMEPLKKSKSKQKSANVSKTPYNDG